MLASEMGGAATLRDAGGDPKTKRLPGTLHKENNNYSDDRQSLGAANCFSVNLAVISVDIEEAAQ
jgi:hypothetical protein